MKTFYLYVLIHILPFNRLNVIFPLSFVIYTFDILFNLSTISLLGKLYLLFLPTDIIEISGLT